MDWIDEGFVLSARRHGENALIVSLLTHDHGRHVGLVRGGSSTRSRGLYQPGNLLRAAWRARLAEHLGTYSCELMRAHAAEHLDDGSDVRVDGEAAPDRHRSGVLRQKQVETHVVDPGGHVHPHDSTKAARSEAPPRVEIPHSSFHVTDRRQDL